MSFFRRRKTDMLACLRAYRDVGYERVCRPGHYPVMEGDQERPPSRESLEAMSERPKSLLPRAVVRYWCQTIIHCLFFTAATSCFASSSAGN